MFLTIKFPKKSPPFQRKMSSAACRQIPAPHNAENKVVHSCARAPDNPRSTLDFHFVHVSLSSVRICAWKRIFFFYSFSCSNNSRERYVTDPSPRIMSLTIYISIPEPGFQQIHWWMYFRFFVMDRQVNEALWVQKSGSLSHRAMDSGKMYFPKMIRCHMSSWVITCHNVLVANAWLKIVKLCSP